MSTFFQGFAAEIPNAYFARLNSFQSDENSPIDYIGSYLSRNIVIRPS